MVAVSRFDVGGACHENAVAELGEPAEQRRGLTVADTVTRAQLSFVSRGRDRPLAQPRRPARA